MLRLARLEGPNLGASHRATVRTSQLEPDSIPLAVYSHSKPIEGLSAKATPTKHSVALSHSSNTHAHTHSKPDQRERGVTDPKPSREPLRVGQSPGSCPDTSREGGTPDEKAGGGEGPPSRHGHGVRRGKQSRKDLTHLRPCSFCDAQARMLLRSLVGGIFSKRGAFWSFKFALPGHGASCSQVTCLPLCIRYLYISSFGFSFILTKHHIPRYWLCLARRPLAFFKFFPSTA